MPDENDAIPERIGQRLVALAQAYELHQLSTLEPYAQNRLNSQQAISLVAELEFLFEHVDDQALRRCAEPLYRLASRCARDTRVELLVEGP
jgi:predicted metal-binding membrane protein